MELNIRVATNKDSENVKKLLSSVLREYGLEPDPENTDKDLNDIESNYIQKQGYFGVIEDGEKLIASMGIYRISSSTCEIRKMYCLEQYRGKGLGKKLMDFAIKKARELGYSHMILETASVLKEAMALYEKYNFKKYTPDHLSPRCDLAYELFL